MRLLLTAFIAFFVMSTSFAQKADGLFKDIGKSNLERLEARMADQVEFCILDDQKMMSKTEAISKIQAFLSNKNVKRSRQVHYGDSEKNGSYYRVGKLKTDNGVFRLFLYFENDQIVELRVDSY